MEDVKKSDEIKEMKEGSIGTTMGGTTMGGTTIRVPPSGVTAAKIKEAVASGAPTTAPTPAPLASVRSFTAKKLHGVLPPPLFDGCHDFTPELTLKGDSAGRPLWVCPDGRIFLEVTSPVYKEACDFLVAIAEPRSRTRFMHEYELTDYSLYAGASLGLQWQKILQTLERFSLFFAEPTFDPSMVQQKVKAVNSEHMKNLQARARRLSCAAAAPRSAPTRAAPPPAWPARRAPPRRRRRALRTPP